MKRFYAALVVASILLIAGATRATAGPQFFGGGAGLTGTDSSRVLKAGDDMSGNLRVSATSAEVILQDTYLYPVKFQKGTSNNAFKILDTISFYNRVQYGI